MPSAWTNRTGQHYLDARAVMSLCLALVCFAAGTGLAWGHPVAPAILIAFFIGWTALVAWRPGIWLFVVPAALPLLNFGPWTGWIGFEEFDLLVLGAAAGGYANLAALPRTMPAGRAGARSDQAVFIGLALLFGVSSAAALFRGWSAAGGARFGWFDGYADPLNCWRVFKSALYAALMWRLLRREISLDVASAARRLGSGMVAGLAVVTLAVVWERAAYPGLWDFSSPYRTTALFWEMHVGGAAIDAYLALATPFVAWALWTSRTPLRWGFAAALALLTVHACLTTFSRGVYIAVAGPLAILGLLLARQRTGPAVRAPVLRALRIGALALGAAVALAVMYSFWGSAGATLGVLAAGLALALLRRRRPPLGWRTWAGLGLAFAIALEVVAVLGLGTFMRERLVASDRDAGARFEHWGNGVALMSGPADALLGIGLGRLPAAYAAAVPGAGFPGEVRLLPEGGIDASGSVELRGPRSPPEGDAQLALSQRVSLRPVWPYRVEFDVRTAARADLLVRVCELHLLYPRQCQAALLRLAPSGSDWRHLAFRLGGDVLDPGDLWPPRHGVFSISLLNAGGAAEFDNLSLLETDDTELLGNRGFTNGLARWFPAAQEYFVPWHIDNMYLEVMIERGLPALLAFVGLLGITLWRLVGGARAAPIAPYLAASLCGVSCISLVSSVMDVPRVAFLMWLLLVFAVEVVIGSERPALDARS